MDSLLVHGVVCSGGGTFKRMVIPGRRELKNHPRDWPRWFFRGSLNVQPVDEFSFARLYDVPKLLTIPQRYIYRNVIGDAHFWRAVLEHDGSRFRCFAMHRDNSTRPYLELVSGEKLRDEMGGVADGVHVTVTIEGVRQ